MSDRPDAPGPLRRRGPRPLLLHLTLAMLGSSSSPAGWPSSNSGSPGSNAGFAEAIGRVAAALGRFRADPACAARTVAGDLAADRELLAGIAAYRRHPWHRDLPDPPAIWQEGHSRLLDYAAGSAGEAVPVLFVPSLVNRAHVLDLAHGRSMLRWLAGQGVRPLLLDWGWPGEVERRFTLTDYVAGRLERALTAAAAQARPVLAGYCMGGTLAVAAAERRPDLIRGLVLLAAPWDFHADDPGRAAALAAALPLFEPAMAFNATLPVDAIQLLFALADPAAIAAKFRAFGRLPQDGQRARLFVALEDWLNDGLPLAAAVARECLSGWYGANSPARGDWRIAGLAVDPARLRLPSLVVVPGRDRIVPPRSARPLSRLIEGATSLEPAAGHVGMVAGSRAEAELWRPLQRWLRDLPLPRPPRGV